MFCRRCWINFSSNELTVQCAGPCSRLFHDKCIGLSSSTSMEMHEKKYLEWYCYDCRKLYRLQLYFEVRSSNSLRITAITVHTSEIEILTKIFVFTSDCYL